MSTSTLINNRRAVPMNIGSLRLYCEEMSLTGKRVIAETSTVSGSDVVTNTSPRCASVTIKGHIFDEEVPLSAGAALDSLLRSTQTLTVYYRGLIFGNCRVLSFNISDSGREYLDVTITLSTDLITEEE